ncbi:MAG: LamG-like jellyroll fold domain-containing protein [Bacteroidia bacterium]
MKNIFTLLFILGAVSVSAQNLNDSIIAEYLFDKNFKDKSANGFDLTNVNGTFVADRNGKDSGAIYLNGSNAYLARTNEAAFYAPEFSYSAWIKIAGLPPNGTAKAIISTGGTIKDNGISISNNYLGQYNGLAVWTYLSGTQSAPYVGIPSFKDTGWHHVMSTCSSDSIKMYLDGMFIGSAYTGDVAGYSGSANGFYIGCRTANTQFYKGVIDDVRIWSRALDAGEVVQVYNSMFTSTKEFSTKQPDIKIYPNPSNGEVNLKKTGADGLLTVKVYNALGQILVERPFEESDLNFNLDTPGVYYVVILNSSGITCSTQRVIID